MKRQKMRMSTSNYIRHYKNCKLLNTRD